MHNNIELARAQEIFDTVVKGLAAQGWKKSGVDAPEGNFKCMYRGPNNLRCAAGMLIPDVRYIASMEGIPVGGEYAPTLVYYLFRKLGYTDDEISFINVLQQQHDYSHDSADMFTRFNIVAGKMGLDTSVLYGGVK